MPEITFSIEDIKKYICQGATDKELFMFVNIAKSYGLNPMKREIHFVKYGTSLANIIVCLLYTSQMSHLPAVEVSTLAVSNSCLPG